MGRATLIHRVALAILVLIPLVSLRSAKAQLPSEVVELIRVPFPQDDGSLTPYSFELGYPLMTLVYDTIMWRDAQGVPRPWLAKSVKTSSGGRLLTIRLRQGVRWHDGVPLTSEDVAFTFDFVEAHFHPRFTPQLSEVRGVQAVDPSTVRIILDHSSPGFVDQPLSDLPILPKHLWEDLPAGRPAPPGLPVGSGPYRLIDYDRGKRYGFRANTAYFRGRPSVTRIDVPIISSREETIDALEQRKVDMLPASLPEEAVQLPELAIDIATGPSYLGTALMFNLREEPFDRTAVRRAVAAAMDLDRMADAAGEAVPAERGYIHPASQWSPDQDLHQSDEDAARSVLADLELSNLQVLAPDNDPLKLEAGRQVILALERAGLEAELREVSRQQLARAVGEDDADPTFQAAIWTLPPLASYDPDFLETVFGSDLEDAPLNYSGYSSGEFDRLADRVASAKGRMKRRQAVEEELRLLQEDAPVVPLFFPEGAFAYRPSVYDGWDYIKGSGILDKRSFLGPGGETPSPVPDPGLEGAPVDDPAIGTLTLVAVGLLAAAIVLGMLLVRRRP